MRVQTLLNRLLHLPGLWVRGLRFEDDRLVIEIRRRFQLLTCPECGTQVSGRFHEKTRRWRHLALWGLPTYLEGVIRRLRCAHCGVRTEQVPWARPDSDFTRPFEDIVAALAQRVNQSAVAEMTGIAWPTVGNIVRRLVAEKLDPHRFDNLRRIGVDEISYRRHHKYLTVVVDHDTQSVVWAAEGKSSETLHSFFGLLGPERLEDIEIVSMDMSAAYQKAVREALPNADIVFDRFHVAQLAQKALEEVRRDQMRDLEAKERKPLKGSRWALLKRGDTLSSEELTKISQIQKFNRPLYRGYLLNESFLDIFDAPDAQSARREIHSWLCWASRSRLKPFVRLARTAREHLDGILRFIDCRLTNARLEGTNNKIRLLSHRAYGFHSAEALIAMIYLCCSKITFSQLQLV
ncbi:MAG: ISL3 family transposase [bacterium]|nr:ISL3 family transposase [bacterium]